MSISSGKLPEFVKKFYVKVIEFCLEYCESIPVGQPTDYRPRQGGEIKAEVFPNFPLLAEKNRYKADEKGSRKDDDVWGVEDVPRPISPLFYFPGPYLFLYRYVLRVGSRGVCAGLMSF